VGRSQLKLHHGLPTECTDRFRTARWNLELLAARSQAPDSQAAPLHRYSLFTEPLTAAMQVAKRVHSLAQQEHNDSALMMGAYDALSCTSFFLGDFEASREYAMRGVQLLALGNRPVSSGRRRCAGPRLSDQ
jgi:hypothetical protein